MIWSRYIEDLLRNAWSLTRHRSGAVFHQETHGRSRELFLKPRREGCFPISAQPLFEAASAKENHLHGPQVMGFEDGIEASLRTLEKEESISS